MQKLHLLPPLIVAEELLLIDSSALRKILPGELVDEAWIGKRKEELSPNITSMVKHFNSLAMLVPTEILAETTSQARAKVISNFIKVAEACHQLKNYHSLKAVLAGLQCTPVYRLKKTWKKVPSIRMRTFQKLSALMAEEGNCTLYQREVHQNVENEVPFVPYLGFFLTQIVHQTCHQQMHTQTVDLRRKGAILKHYTLHTSITISSSQSDEDDGTAHSCPNGFSEAPCSPIAHTCSIRAENPICTTEHGTNPCDSTGCTVNHISSSGDAAASSNTNTCAENLLSLGSAFPHHICPTNLLCPPQSSLRPPLECSSPFSSSPFGTLRQPCTMQKSHSAELLSPQCDNTTTVDEIPNSPMLVLKASVSLDELSNSCPHKPLNESNDHLRKLADSGVYSPEGSIDEDPAVSLPIYGSAGNSRENICVSPLLCSTRLSMNMVPDEESSDAVDNTPSRCFTLSMHSPQPSKRPASAGHLGLIKRRQAIEMNSVPIKHLRTPKELLNKYQICSLGCATSIESKQDIRNLITTYHCNSEMENYVLSHQREPP